MKSILVPIDCSAASTRIVDLARQVAKAFAAEIHLIHVREISLATPSAPIGYGVSGMPELMPMPMIDPGAQTLPEKSHRAELAEWQKEIEQAGRRPALVLSPATYNRPAGLALVCPITNQTKGYPFEVALPKSLPISGVVLVDHLKSIDWAARRAQFVARAPADVVADVIARLRPSIGL